MLLAGRCFRFQLLFGILLLTYRALFTGRFANRIRPKFENNDSSTESLPVHHDWRVRLDSYIVGEWSCDVGEFSKWRRCPLSSPNNTTSALTFTPIGRTGNLMYEYAGAIGTAIRRGMIPLLPYGTGLERCFNFLDEYYPHDRGLEFVEIHPPDLYYSPDWLREGWSGNVRLNSLMQSWKYFGHVDEMLRNLFQFRRSSITAADEFLGSGKSRSRPGTGSSVFVSIHVRRTDFVDTYGSLIKPIPTGYIQEAMALFRNLYRHLVRFVVVSDDPDWCKRNLNITGNDLLSEGLDACDDLAILSKCNHSIITAGSSFGWWGAFLANGHVTYYPGWLKSGSWYNLKYVESDFFLPRWKRLNF
ncbi:hypothetical protein LSH36_99g08056 [Paralvinella palmiformis]|uniref:L-Fucosyltransferase n=1 Tax=Paralvinella palmiformis TaxID=53620 RepID=A0AAD9K010_9ANNE|nr:hypothetical protein LSH36_99g08056 [Paralvinella palmiformis]